MAKQIFDVIQDLRAAGRPFAVATVVETVGSVSAKTSSKVVVDEQGRPRFTKYVLTERKFVNMVRNYPYPFVVAGLCWEIPAVMPDDCLGKYFRGPAQPDSIRDMKAAIDATISLGGENYVFWGGREGYVNLMLTDMKRELENMGRFLTLARDYGRWLPWVDAYYGSAAYMPLVDGATYAIALSHSGLLVRPADFGTWRALDHWN